MNIMHSSSFVKFAIISSSLLSFAGCAMLGLSSGPQATAVISPSSSAAASSMNPQGTVRFVQVSDGVMVSGRITGLRPGKEHGFHVHEAADCSGDAMGTKGHFNPDGSPHGKLNSGSHHAGDLPALVADANGVADFNAKVAKLTVVPGPSSVVGRGLIVHRDPDDYTAQPTGNAGPRPGCGVIRAN
jgi:Cu-Zn family superoxide dismutase